MTRVQHQPPDKSVFVILCQCRDSGEHPAPCVQPCIFQHGSQYTTNSTSAWCLINKFDPHLYCARIGTGQAPATQDGTSWVAQTSRRQDSFNQSHPGLPGHPTCPLSEVPASCFGSNHALLLGGRSYSPVLQPAPQGLSWQQAWQI